MSQPLARALCDRVRAEMVSLLASGGETELDVLYRTLLKALGSEVVCEIGHTIARLVREGALEIETRARTPEGPFVGIARLTRPVVPPYAAILA